jgi:hypothetical protein
MHAHILGDRPTPASATRHQDRLTPIAQPPVASRFEGVFQLRFFRCRQPNSPHRFCPPLMRTLSREYLKKEARSSGACISQLNDALVPLVSLMQQGNPVERISKQTSHAGRFGVP